MTTPTEPVAAVRRFNRFYTRLVGALDEAHLATDYSLAESRVLYELAHREGATATEIGRELGLDAGYLSRILRRFDAAGLVARDPSATDARRSHLRLTDAGRAAYGELDARAHADVAARIDALAPHDRTRLLGAMRTVESVLGTTREPSSTAFALRDERPGDLGWVVSRNGWFYADAFGWDMTYEGLVAQIVADYTRSRDAKLDRCWIAESDGENVGCIFCVRHPERDGVAKLRMLYVEPSARGLGVGTALVNACIAFARDAGYHTLTLWTNDILASARRIYEAEGFRLVDSAPHHSFGCDLVGQTWELPLGTTNA